jgi:hypothetical protein
MKFGICTKDPPFRRTFILGAGITQIVTPILVALLFMPGSMLADR